MEYALRLESELAMNFRHVAMVRIGTISDIMIPKYLIPRKAALEGGTRLEDGGRDEVRCLL
jgi:hypothetical protein